MTAASLLWLQSSDSGKLFKGRAVLILLYGRCKKRTREIVKSGT
jgi:hypothetical protein